MILVVVLSTSTWGYFRGHGFYLLFDEVELPVTLLHPPCYESSDVCCGSVSLAFPSSSIGWVYLLISVSHSLLFDACRWELEMCGKRGMI
jgi:hypothetical protein